MIGDLSLIGAGLLVGFFYAISVTLEKEWVMDAVDDTLLLTLFVYPLTAIVLFPLYFTDYVSLISPWKIGLSAGLGISYFVPLYLYFRSLRLDDAAVISTMMRLIPVATVGFSAIFLGQFLDPISYVGIALVFGGASLVAVDFTNLKHISFSPGLGFVLLSVALYGFVNTGLEFVLATVSMWNYLFWSTMGAAAVSVPVLLFRESSRTILVQSLNGENPAIPRLCVSKSAELVGRIFFMYGASLGPVGVVSTLSSIEPLFIILLISGWGWFRGRNTVRQSRREWGIRVVAAGLVFAGVVVL